MPERVDIGVSAVADGNFCSTECPYFSVEMGASFERPAVEHCKLFLVDLHLSETKRILRCAKCCEGQRDWRRKVRAFALTEKAGGRKGALKLLRDTRYEIDIWEYPSAAELLSYLMHEHGLTYPYLRKLLGVGQDHLDQLLKGVDHPYLLQPMRQVLGYPKAPPPDYMEMISQRANTIKASERE